MKYIRLKNLGIIISLSLMVVFSGCVKHNFDEPPIDIPHVDFDANCSIAGLKAMLGTQDMVEITADTIIEGIVTANDESGNIYKKLYIRDNSGGLEMGIDQTSLYTTYKVGQRIFIKCKGLYLGNYADVVQLGYPYNGSIGRIPAAMLSGRFFLDSLPGPAPVPDTLDLSGALGGKVSTLIALKNVRFPDAGSTFVIPGETNSNRDIADAFGNVISIGGKNLILRTSSYANFANDKMPDGVGTLIGIFSVFNGQYQVYIRDINDTKNFVDTGNKVIYQQNFDADPPDWIKFAKTGGKPWTWDATYSVMVANGYQGTAPCETWLVSPAIDLTGISNPILTFKTWTKYTDSGLANPLDVYISTNYSGTGDPTTADWATIQCALSPANSGIWTSSGDVSLAAFNQPVYIAYRYRSSGVTSNTASKWEVDTFKVTGKKNQ